MRRIAVVEDTPEIAADLERMIRSEPEFEFIAKFGSAEAALAKLPQLKPDLCILDIGLPGMTGIHALPELKKKLPQMKIVVFTVFEDSEHILNAIRQGANGYLLKDTPPQLFISELKVILLGGATLTPRVAVKISQMVPKGAPAPEETEPEAAAAPGVLTARQIDILNHIALGFDYREIADELNISAHTVRRHIENIYERLQVNNRREAIRAGFKFGFLKNIAKWVS